VSADALVPPSVDPSWFDELRERQDRHAAIQIRGLGVRYGGTSAIGTLGALVGRRRPTREVWALRDIDLTVRAGDCFAIVGRNGAGKSTLLRVMGQLIDHDTGSVRVRGRINALLNLGVGFDPHLTGRENVHLLGALMGLRPAQIRQRVPEVIEFADIGDFIDAPLRTYSTGMRARLGFAAATALTEPHVLLLDEVMGTGDAAFQERSHERVMELIRGAHAVVVASHDMSWVSANATYAVLLDGGRIIAEGAPAGVTTLYRARSVKPPRRYACPECEEILPSTLCSTCGVWRHPRAEASPGARDS
jgi:lipopolysaccharide transport system ATP-binding protein